ncbi:MAG: low temperature requirement protein A [Candidatus Moduliflexus flocculans]|nr:low temperature requirement protein A [Candidatus Moduliflexus flocculans]
MSTAATWPSVAPCSSSSRWASRCWSRGATFASHAWTAATAGAFLAAFVSAVAMWWLYFDKGVASGHQRIVHGGDPGRAARLGYTYLHLPVIAGIIVCAVADELVLAHPDHASTATVSRACSAVQRCICWVSAPSSGVQPVAPDPRCLTLSVWAFSRRWRYLRRCTGFRRWGWPLQVRRCLWLWRCGNTGRCEPPQSHTERRRVPLPVLMRSAQLPPRDTPWQATAFRLSPGRIECRRGRVESVTFHTSSRSPAITRSVPREASR